MSNEDGRFPAARSLRIEELLATYEGAIDDVDALLAEESIAGPLPKPEEPNDVSDYIQRDPTYNDPLPPDDLTEVPDVIIGKLFSFYQNWTNYVASEVTRTKCLRDIQQRSLEVVKSAVAIYYREEKGVAAAMINDYVNVDSRYVEVDGALLRLKVVYETMHSREAQLRRTLNNISREQTRRANELERLLHDEHGGKAKSRGGRESPKVRRNFGGWKQP